MTFLTPDEAEIIYADVKRVFDDLDDGSDRPEPCAGCCRPLGISDRYIITISGNRLCGCCADRLTFKPSYGGLTA